MYQKLVLVIVYNLRRKSCQGPPAILVEPVQRQQNDSILSTKQNGACVPPPLLPAVPTWLFATFYFCVQVWIKISKLGVLPTLQDFNENHWRPLTAFPFKVLDNVSSIGSGDGMVASSQSGTILKGTEVLNLYEYFKYIFLTFPGIYGSPPVQFTFDLQNYVI